MLLNQDLQVEVLAVAVATEGEEEAEVVVVEEEAEGMVMVGKRDLGLEAESQQLLIHMMKISQISNNKLPHHTLALPTL